MIFSDEKIWNVNQMSLLIQSGMELAQIYLLFTSTAGQKYILNFWSHELESISNLVACYPFSLPSSILLYILYNEAGMETNITIKEHGGDVRWTDGV